MTLTDTEVTSYYTGTIESDVVRARVWHGTRESGE